MKRLKSSAGRAPARGKGKGEMSSRPKSGYSKGPGSKKSRGGAKPFRDGDKSGDRTARFKRDESSTEKGHFKRSPARVERSRTNFTRGTGPKPEGFRREGDKPKRRSFDRGPARPYGKTEAPPRRDGDRPVRFKREGNDSERRDFKKPFDKTSTGGGTYLRRKDDRPDRIKREEGDTEKRSSFKPKEESGDSPKRETRSPFRERPVTENKGDFAERKKRKRIGDEKKPFVKREVRSTGGFKSAHSTQRNDSPRSYGENRYEKRPPKEKKRGSFEPRPKTDRPERPWNRKEKHEFYGDRRKPAPEFLKASEDGSIRLNKYIANAGICSRREADDMIIAGVISVNGEVITELGYKVMPTDNVKYNNELLRGERLVYILLNKPKDFITTTDDPENRKTVMGLIEKACKERVYPVGRLDRNTTGVLLFTNDGDLAKKLTHPSFQVHKVYQAELDRSLKTSDMELISQGVTLDDGFIKPDEIVYAGPDKNVIGMELHSGKNRIVRRIFEHLGYEVKKLDRVVFAGLTKKDVPRGRWRFLTEMEIANLKMITGKKMAKY